MKSNTARCITTSVHCSVMSSHNLETEKLEFHPVTRCTQRLLLQPIEQFGKTFCLNYTGTETAKIIRESKFLGSVTDLVDVTDGGE